VKNAVFIIIFFLLAKPVMPVLDYVVNYDYIVKELCVNRQKPQMHCNGKCHLMQGLAKAADQQKQESDKKSAQQQAEVLFYAPIANVAIPISFPIIVKQQAVHYSNLYSQTNYQSVFHPPTSIS
jgi:hypothetical protein